MLIMTLFMSVSLLILRSNKISFVIVVFFTMLNFILNLNTYFNNPIYLINSYTMIDEMGLFMSLLTFFVMFMAYIYSMSFKNYKLMSITLFSLVVFCYQVFSTNNLFVMYFFYEASLIPILYIIVKWGSYPERSASAMMMLVYTLLFSAPFLMILVFVFYCFDTFYMDIMNTYITFTPLVLSLLIFFTFAVKLPIYGLHQWLPMAHVEAPTFGSVILASLLLKLGGVGLVRVFVLMNLNHLTSFLMGYFMVFIIFSTVVCCFQSDMKRLIAYSSVAHMMVIPFLVFGCNILSLQTLTMVMLFHGLSSSLLFMIVGILYSMYSSRQLILMRGLILVSPLLSFITILTFFFTISAPPFPSFIAEVYFMLSTYFMSDSFIYIYIVFAFLGLVYNLNWLTSVLFSSSLPMAHSESLLKFNLFLPLLLIIFMSFSIVLIYPCFYANLVPNHWSYYQP